MSPVFPKTEVVPVSTPDRRVRRRFALLRRPVAVVSLVYLLIILFASLFPWLVASHDPLETDFAAALQGPSATHWLGTDQLGRDVFSRLVHGGLPMIVACVQATVLATALGLAGGMVAGYFKGGLDRTLGWVVDIIMSLPVMVILLVVLTIDSSNLTPAMIALGFLIAPVPMRVIRSVTLEARNDGYIAAARVAGLSHARIIVRHVLPRVYGPMIVQASLAAGVALTLVTGLAFVGLGVSPPDPTWGSMVAEAAQVMRQHPWMLLPTGGLIALTVLFLGLLGDSLRDLLAERAAGMAPRAAVPSAKLAIEPIRVELPAPSADTLLAVRDLTIVRRQGGRANVLVDGMSFDVHRGEIVGLVGESGSGKTLTARALLGILPRTVEVAAGQVFLEGVDRVGQSQRSLAAARRSALSYVAQDPSLSLDPSFSIGSTLVEALKWREGLTGAAARQRAVELLRSVQLQRPEQLLDHYPHQLSGGMAQRVGIARALAGSPKLLVADEPTTALDVTVQSEILALLRDLRDETGMGILFITHNWGAVADLCDSVVVMYHGELVESGAVEDIFFRPRHPYSEALLRSSPYFSTPGAPLPTQDADERLWR